MKKSKSAKIQIKLHKDIRKLLKKFEKNPNVYWDNRHLFGELIDNWLEISKIDEQLLVKYRELKHNKQGEC